MFNSVKIKNYRSFGVNPSAKAHNFTLGPLTVVVGSNSSGKSNLLRALEFATDPSVDRLTRSDFYIGIYSGRERKSQAIEIEIDASHGGATHQISCNAQGTDAKGYSKHFTINGTSYPAVTRTAPPTPQLMAALAPFNVFVAPTIRDVDYLNSALELLPLATRSVVLKSTNGLRSSLAAKLAQVCAELRAPLNVSGVAVRPAFTLESLLANIRLNFNVSDGVQLPLANLGQGHISQAILKLAQMRGGSAVTCIEEPEIHVHPTGIRNLVRTLRNAVAQPGQQVIVTTHSPDFINQLLFDELVCVKKVAQKSVVSQFNPAAVGFNAAKVAGLQHKVIRQDQRGAIFLSKLVLLVEGAYDRLVLEAIDRSGAIGLLEADVTVLDMGGKGQLPDYHALLMSLGRPHAVLLDGDMLADSSGGVATPTAGVLEQALLGSGVYKSGWVAGYVAALASKSPSALRTESAAISAGIATKGVSVAAHGHHDISGAIEECILSATPAEKGAAYVALKGSNPTPTSAEIDALLSLKARSKRAPMVEVVSAFEPKVFARISKQVRRAIQELL